MLNIRLVRDDELLIGLLDKSRIIVYNAVHFVIDFFVDMTVDCWQNQFRTLPWPDYLAMSLPVYIKVNAESVRKQTH